MAWGLQVVWHQRLVGWYQHEHWQQVAEPPFHEKERAQEVDSNPSWNPRPPQKKKIRGSNPNGQMEGDASRL